MGKYMKKPKLTTTTPASEITKTPLGVLTRAKTLAIQTLRSSSSAAVAPPLTSSDADYCYLQLRSRRLQKACVVKQSKKENVTGYWASGSGGSAHEDLWVHAENKLEEQFGENDLEFESTERGSRENTPCSFNMDAETTVTTSSSTRGLLSSAPNRRQQSLVPTNIPSKHEIDEFFAFTELQQELLFIERYNFDIKNDIPLSGRYEWVKVDQ